MWSNKLTVAYALPFPIRLSYPKFHCMEKKVWYYTVSQKVPHWFAIILTYTIRLR